MKLILSRRNLYSLLHKLEMEGSARTIVKYADDCDTPIAIQVVEDAECYKDRSPGSMHPETEDFIYRLTEAMRDAGMGGDC